VRDKIGPAAEQPIERFMTTNLVTARGHDPIEKVVRYIVDAHIHRVLVVDKAGKLEGLITTTDLLAAILRAGALMHSF
jgi:CBS-domain-containing membrane protein